MLNAQVTQTVGGTRQTVGGSANVFDYGFQVATSGLTSYAPGVVALDGSGNPLAVDANNTLKTGKLPLGTPLSDGHTGSASALNCTLPKAAGKLSYLSGLVVSGLGATGAGSIQVTVTGLLGTAPIVTVPVPAGATVGVGPVVVTFDPPLQASGANVDIVVNVPSFGTGNTVASSGAWGFQV